MSEAPDSEGIFRLDNKTAVVTGGASGIGQAIVELFAAQGACVHIVDINGEQAQVVAKSVADAGRSAVAHECDLTDEARVESLFRDVIGRTGIDILVNSVGMAHIGTLETTTPADFDLVFRVNVKSFYNSMRAAVQRMRRGGAILNLASVAATAALADRFAYSMSKGAVLSMTVSVAKDYLKHNIRCNCISPARVHTPFVDGFIGKNYPGREEEIFRSLSQSAPIGRMAEPKEVASLALFLCSDEAAFITGSDYPIDGGFFNLHG